ncbi:MAG: hypothetical protein JJE13_06655 [Thermoleophilia bacterium]|nr:hypothetical protein [Thermoleophilia bacterium]
MNELSKPVGLLVAMSEAFDEPHPNTGSREPLLFLKFMGGQQLQHHAFDADDEAIDEELLESLADQGLVRLSHTAKGSTQIFVTEKGQKLAAEARRLIEGDPALETQEAIDLDWDAVVRPVLQHTYEHWKKQGAPISGVLSTRVADDASQSDLEALRAISLLAESGYLSQAGSLSTDLGPTAVTVTPRGLEIVGGWPSTTGQAAAEALIAALDREIEEAEGQPERQGKLKELREVATDVGQGVLSDVLTRVITGGLN